MMGRDTNIGWCQPVRAEPTADLEEVVAAIPLGLASADAGPAGSSHRRTGAGAFRLTRAGGHRPAPRRRPPREPPHRGGLALADHLGVAVP
jgi:hypothetical protein